MYAIGITPMTDASELNVIADSPFNSSIVYIGDFDDLLREQLVMMVEEKIKTVSTLELLWM